MNDLFENQIRILVVDDEPHSLSTMATLLENEGFEVLVAGNGDEGIEHALLGEPDLILLDILMPGNDGFEICRRLKSMPETAHIPVIFLSAVAEARNKVRGFEVGGADYITKPFHEPEVLARIRTHVTLRRQQQRLQSLNTDLRKEVEARKRAVAELENTLDATTDGIWTWHLEANTLSFSPKYYTMLGYAPGAFPPGFETWKDLIHPEDLDRALSVATRWLEYKQDEYENELRMRTADGDYRWIRVRGRVVERDEAGEAVYMIGNHEDVTERKLAEQERRELEARLRQSQKLEAVGTLAGGIAHNFNNLLFPIVGYAEMAADELPLDSPVRRHLTGILNAALRARDLVSQILAFSRKAETEMEPVQISPILNESLKMIRASIPTTVEIRHEMNATGPVMADPTQIHQVVMNLCTNAFHAMEEAGGTLTVRLEEVEISPEAAAGHPGAEPGRYARIRVSDTGVGMEPAVVERVFEPYFTTKGQGKGTGLGLAVVHGIMVEHGGFVTVESEVGRGSTVSVHLPLIEPAGTAADVSLPETGAACRGTERIMVVDDERSIVRLLRQMLEGLGYTVTAREGSLDALTAFSRAPDRFDLVITDMTMPNLTGDKLARRIREIRPEIPVIICTGFSDRISPETAEAEGVTACLIKPIPRADLARAVRRALDGAA